MPANKHGSRERVAEAGFTVAGERLKAYPLDYTIVGGKGPNDMTADVLLALYPGDTANHKRARGIILGARDRLRLAKPPPREFIESCRNGITQDVGVADLREDKNGRSWVVLLVGRQRIMARRILDAEGARHSPPAPPLHVWCTFHAFVGKDFDAELAALEANCTSNIFVAEPPSVKASRAAALTAKGMDAGSIALRIGATGAAHVDLLVDLAACDESVWDAVDRNLIPLADAPKYKGLASEEQARRVARKVAGPSKAARDTAAPARSKARPARVLASVQAEVLATVPEGDTSDTAILRTAFAEALAWAAGGEAPEWARPIIESAEKARTGRGA